MELVAGPDLRTLLSERGPLDGASVRRVLAGVLGALAATHAAGLVHRDVTPSNILLTDDPFARWEAKLTDLGIARRLLSAPLTGAGLVVGTAAYLSPEQVVGGEVGPATDIYSLSLVAVEALTGVTPFPGSAVESATSSLLRCPALPAGLAPEWEVLLRAATSVDPTGRPDIAAFRNAVDALPEDAGVRPGRRTRLGDAIASEPDHREPGASARSRADLVPLRSTAVIPASSPATAVMRAAERTAQFATEWRRHSRSRAVVLLAASTAIIGGFATVGSAALMGTHLLEVVTVARNAVPSMAGSSSAAPRPSSSSSQATRSDGTVQSEPVPADEQAAQATADPGAWSDAAPAAVGGGAADGARGPGRRPDQAVPGPVGPAAGTIDRAAPVGPSAP